MLLSNKLAKKKKKAKLKAMAVCQNFKKCV